jgi:hypothetical protein
MELKVSSIRYTTLLKMILEQDATWAILSAINFEECCVKVCKEILSICLRNKGLKVRFYPFRLISRRVGPRSALEIVKDQFQEELEILASQAGISFGVTYVEYPTSLDSAVELLAKARGTDEPLPKLVLDLSAVTREIAVYLCDTVMGSGGRSWPLHFEEIYLVHTSPERVTSRLGLGPFSVGGIKCVYSPELIRRLPESLRISLIVFPGYEGFEAKAAVDALAGHQAQITVAVNCFENTFPKAMELLTGNLSLVEDAADQIVDLRYYFSEDDALRITLDVVDRAVQFCEEYPRLRHVFLVAPFGPKSSVAIGCIARHIFESLCFKKFEGIYTKTDVLLLPISQSVSLYSRGARTPHILKLST